MKAIEVVKQCRGDTIAVPIVPRTEHVIDDLVRDFGFEVESRRTTKYGFEVITLKVGWEHPATRKVLGI